MAVLSELLRQDLVDNAQRRGAQLRARLEAMARRHRIVGDVCGVGLLQGVEFVADRATKRPFPPGSRPGKVVERAARERGPLLRCGNDFAAFRRSS